MMTLKPIGVLLNNNICGGLSGEKTRVFERVESRHLKYPEMSRSEFLEALPTMWASAFIFERAIESKDQNALFEWMALLLLYYYRVLHLENCSKTKLEMEYDRDLWPALSGTYPSGRLDSLQILTTARGTVVGGYYPNTFFFPSRGRSEWLNDENLQPYIEEHTLQLSWSRSCSLLLSDELEQSRFKHRLESLAKLPGISDQVRGSMSSFIRSANIFRNIESLEPLEILDPDPKNWLRGGEQQLSDLLSSYPFKQKRNGGVTYYLVTDLPISAEWMKQPISPGLPAPNQYERNSRTQIRVRFGEEHIIQLGQNDEIVLLRDLFLDRAPYYCALDKQLADENTALIRRLHKHEIKNNTGTFNAVKANDEVICFAPMKSEIFIHFPEVLSRPEKYLTVRGRNIDGGLDWGFEFFGNTIILHTIPSGKPLQNMSLSIWPPTTHEKWRTYLLHGTGAEREKCGRLRLIGERGQVASEDLELADDEYISILKPDKNAVDLPCRPRALTILDSTNNERGVLFLVETPEPAIIGKTASLAVDFGTSNTSLAYKFDSKPEPMLLTLGPIMLWGTKPKTIIGGNSIELENPGFVPFNWGGSKGFFPTIFLKRRNANLEGLIADKLEIEHLFQIDIPGLHKDMESRVFDGSLQDGWPKLYKDLKWHSDQKQTWQRTVFLGLVLLYAHAELFFRYGAIIERYVFTFPLAFTSGQETAFKEITKDVVNRIRALCLGTSTINPEYIDESSAIAESVRGKPNLATLEVFIDIGGGTSDIAIRYNGEFLVLDSIKVAGKSFFAFAKQNFNSECEVAGSDTFKQHLGRLLLNSDSSKDVEDTINAVRSNLDLGNVYSLLINRLDDRKFRQKEEVILEKGMGWPSYQLFRTELFFRHILTYALLQACAVVADHKLSPAILSNGIHLILSGNGWGLLLFGGVKRSNDQLIGECNQILELLKGRLLKKDEYEEGSDELNQEYNALKGLRVADLDLLNERSLSKAKTDVTVGALSSQRERSNNSRLIAPPYTGMTLNPVQINNIEQIVIRWCNRWGLEEIKEKIGHQRLRGVDTFDIGSPENYQQAFDSILTVFTILGGMDDADPLPGKEWARINSELGNGHRYIDGKVLTDRSPINQFVSDILYPEESDHSYLDVLAEHNKTIK